MKFVVSVYVEAPMKFYGRVTKTTLKEKEFKVIGVGWPHASFICNSCGAFTYQAGELDK